MEHHERAIAAYCHELEGRTDVVGLIVVGSVARGTEREDSDIDVYLVLSDDAFDEAAARDAFATVEREGLDYPGSYIDIKYASPRYLARAAEAGDDPTRASFRGARVVLGDGESLGELVERIAHPPEARWRERVRSHVAQVRLYGNYFLKQSEQLDDVFLARHASLHLCLAAARAALAELRVLVPGAKYIQGLMAGAALPDGFFDAWLVATRSGSYADGQLLVAAVEDWLGGACPREETLSVFIRDNELSWLRGTLPPEYA